MMLLTKFITATSFALLYCCLLLDCSGMDVEETNSELELKAVFINCDPHDILEEAEAARRVQREELLTTHGKLDGCLKKIGITVKLVSDPAMSEGEEYIPVEQVVSAGARARLLNPYVLRLRRDRPQQAYPLTLRGIRRQRDIVFKEGDEWAKGLAYLQQWINNFTKPANTNKSSETLNIITERMNNSCNADGFEKWHRTKRFDDNLIIDNTVHEAKDKHIPNVLSIVNRSKAKRVPVVEEGLGVISVDNRKFTLYDIGEPVVRHTVSVQLFERDTDRDGKTVWSDVTKGNIASVGPQKPEFEGPNLAVHYRSLEWLDRDKFALPKKPLCLLVSEENEPSTGMNMIDQVVNHVARIGLISTCL
ncbi:hypothetical protein JYU34_011486 [Plutella xylostella]|uniref:Uncharacterized protein n=1 Tax=Plutella xylostella TaxID=51655 RepID=A0ABQ7QH37_PLUXY|nr:hypothetical protein JYU34_011486 [Plutella xylostella]